MINYYKVLEVSSDASEEVIRVAYKALAKKYHPDVCKDKKIIDEKMKLINEAYETLIDLEKRAVYDKWFNEEAPQPDISFSQTGEEKEEASVSPASYIKRPKKKFGIIKTGVLIYIVYLGISWFSGNSNSDSVEALTETNVTASITTPAGESESGEVQADNVSVWSTEYLSFYLQNKSLEIYDFSKEEKKASVIAKKVKPEQCYIKGSGGFLNNSIITYKKTDEETDFVYMGEIKDEKPDGYGMLYKLINYGSDYEPVLARQVVYEGMFKKGKYSGFGKSYFFFQDENEAWKFREFVEQSGDAQKCVNDYFNELEYVGYFENGQFEGNGIFITYPDKLYTSTYSKRISMRADEDPQYYTLGIVSSNFKKGEMNGEAKLYYADYLSYDGEVKKDTMDGKGKLYYKGSDHIKYEGDFFYGEIKGKGILYDYDGNIVVSGQWKNNMCGLINAEDYQSPEMTQIMSVKDVSQGVVDKIVPETSTDAENYILPDSNLRYITREEITSFSKEALRLARNEIYARHGRKFESEDLRQYFESQPWYNGYLSQEEFDDGVLNEYERENLDLLKAIENGQTDGGAGSSDGYLEAYREIINRAYGQYGDNIYFVYDIEQNGIPELIVQEGTSEADFMYVVYTYNGTVREVGSISGGHSMIYGEPDQNAIISVSGYMGYQVVTRIIIKNGMLNESTLMEGDIALGQDYYSTPYDIPYAYVNDLILLN